MRNEVRDESKIKTLDKLRVITQNEKTKEGNVQKRSFDKLWPTVLCARGENSRRRELSRQRRIPSEALSQRERRKEEARERGMGGSETAGSALPLAVLPNDASGWDCCGIKNTPLLFPLHTSQCL